MNWDALGEVEDDDHFFETYDRLSSAFTQDLASSGSDDDDFQDGRMSFASAVSSASKQSVHSIESIPNPSSILGNYDMWMADPGDVKERRRRLLQGMGLSSKKDLLRLASAKIGQAISRNPEQAQVLTTREEEPKRNRFEPEAKPEPEPEPSTSTPIVLVRSRSDGDIDTFSARSKQRKEELIGPKSKQRLTRTSSGQLVPSIGVCKYSNANRMTSRGAKKRPSMPNNKGLLSDGGLGSFFLIKNLDSGKEFIVKEYNEEGMWNKLSDVQTGKQLTMEEFEKSVGHSPVVKELMRRRNVSRHIPDRQVVDWIDIREMVTAACYTPDGQVASWPTFHRQFLSTFEGCSNRFTSRDLIVSEFCTLDCKLEPHIDVQKKKKPQAKKIPVFQAKGVQSQAEKITGLQFAPTNPSEMLITSANSRIRLYTGSEVAQKFKGVRNTSSQISASFSPDGRHVISASEDSQVYIWKVEESKNSGNGKVRNRIKVQANEHFHCKDVAVAIPWPGSIRTEPPFVELHSKRHSKRLSAPLGQSIGSSPTREDNLIGTTSSRRHFPPLPKIKNGLERSTSCADEDFAHSARTDPGIGISESFTSSSQSIRYGDSPSISASGTSPSHSWSSSWSLFDSIGHGNHGGQTVQATAWGMVIVTASLEGEIKVYQNFGLPVKVSRQANLFRDH